MRFRTCLHRQKKAASWWGKRLCYSVCHCLPFVRGLNKPIHVVTHGISPILCLRSDPCVSASPHSTHWDSHYDGYNFKVFRHDPLDSNSPWANNFGGYLDEDGSGNLWFATPGNWRYMRFDRQSETFTTIPTPSADFSCRYVHHTRNTQENLCWVVAT